MPERLDGKRILVVDHDASMVATIVGILSGAGATIRAAYDGAAAIEKADEFDPHLVILDLRLPKRSGHLVLEYLKRNHQLKLTDSRPPGVFQDGE